MLLSGPTPYWWVLPNIVTLFGAILFGFAWIFLPPSNLTYLFWLMLSLGIFLIMVGIILTSIRRRRYYAWLRENCHQGATYIVTTPPQTVYGVPPAGYQPVYGAPPGYQPGMVPTYQVPPQGPYSQPAALPPYNPNYS